MLHDETPSSQDAERATKPEAAEAQRTTTVAAHERQKRPHSGGREAIPAHLPRVEILHDLPQHEKWCSHEHEGVCWAKECIGRESSERYHYEPPKIWVERHVYPKYSCGHCHQGVMVAEAARSILPKSNASSSMLAHLVTSKFVDGLPIYRTCRQLQRQQLQLSPGTAATWVNTLGSESVVPLINLMNDELLAEGLIQMDETFLQVLHSEKSPSSDHYMVVRIADSDRVGDSCVQRRQFGGTCTSLDASKSRCSRRKPRSSMPSFRKVRPQHPTSRRAL